MRAEISTGMNAQPAPPPTPARQRAMLFVHIPTHFPEMLRAAELLLASGRWEPLLYIATAYPGIERDFKRCEDRGVPCLGPRFTTPGEPLGPTEAPKPEAVAKVEALPPPPPPVPAPAQEHPEPRRGLVRLLHRGRSGRANSLLHTYAPVFQLIRRAVALARLYVGRRASRAASAFAWWILKAARFVARVVTGAIAIPVRMVRSAVQRAMASSARLRDWRDRMMVKAARSSPRACSSRPSRRCCGRSQCSRSGSGTGARRGRCRKTSRSITGSKACCRT
jgi:hypothetical protein